MHLVKSLVDALLAADEPADEAWVRARHAVGAAAVDEPDLIQAIEQRDLAALRAIAEGWRSGKRLLLVHDREVLKRAMKAYRKSFKVTRLDAESSLGGGPFSAGRHSGISGITPPPRYPRDVWDELVRQGRLIACGHGVYELPPE
jgi:hypothetical protein